MWYEVLLEKKKIMIRIPRSPSQDLQKNISKLKWMPVWGSSSRINSDSDPNVDSLISLIPSPITSQLHSCCFNPDDGAVATRGHQAKRGKGRPHIWRKEPARWWRSSMLFKLPRRQLHFLIRIQSRFEVKSNRHVD